MSEGQAVEDVVVKAVTDVVEVKEDVVHVEYATKSELHALEDKLREEIQFVRSYIAGLYDKAKAEAKAAEHAVEEVPHTIHDKVKKLEDEFKAFVHRVHTRIGSVL